MESLADQPAPEGGEGWHPDPLGNDKLRYFDGTAWTDRIHKPEARTPAKKGGGFPRPHWRKMTWVIVIWCVVTAAWIIGALVSADNSSKCAHETG